MGRNIYTHFLPFMNNLSTKETIEGRAFGALEIEKEIGMLAVERKRTQMQTLFGEWLNRMQDPRVSSAYSRLTAGVDPKVAEAELRMIAEGKDPSNNTLAA